MREMAELSAFTSEDVDALLADETFLNAGRYHAQESPRAVLLAGQPGAGKTELSTMMLAQMGGDAAFINGDDYRRYHPNYRQLFAEYGSDAVSMTSPFSNTVVERLIDDFSDRRFHLIIEGTGRDADVPRATAEKLAGKGYHVELAAIATRPEVSLTSTLLRFCRMNANGTIPRATAIEAHDAVVRLLPGNLDVLRACPSITRIRIWNRDQALLYDSVESQAAPSQALLGYWNSEWSAREIDEIERQLRELRSDPVLPTLGQQEVLDELVRRVQAAARGV